MARTRRRSTLMIAVFLGLSACGQISETALDQAPATEPPTDSGPGQSLSPTGGSEADDQLQPLENPPPTLAATDDDSEAEQPSVSPGSTPDSTADVEWITIQLDNLSDDVHEVNAAIPAGWVPHSVFEGRWQPAEDTGFGFFTDIGFDTSCDGICEAKNWEASLNSPDGRLARLRQEYNVLRDEAITDGWILITEGEVVSRRVNVFRWNNDADYYFECRVELDDEDIELVDEMLEVCLLSDPLWLD